MNIDRLNQGQTDPASVGEQAAARRAERGSNDAAPQLDPGRPRPAGDTLEISDRSRELARARQAVEDAPDVRADKVAEIKQRLEDGTYSVSPELLARKLLGMPDEA
jgi:negative regulator of flagellin synthesis FlgM